MQIFSLRKVSCTSFHWRAYVHLVLRRKNLHGIIKSSPCSTNAVCLFPRWSIESTRSRNPANNSLSLSVPLSTSVFEYTPIKAVSRCTLGKLLLPAARFFIYYISARVTQRNTQSLVTDVKQKTWAWSFYREETLY